MGKLTPDIFVFEKSNMLYLHKDKKLMDNTEKRFEELEAKIDNLATQIANGFQLAYDELYKIDTKISELRGDSKENLGNIESEMKKGFSEVISELKKINSITRYSEQHDDLEKFPLNGKA